MTAVTKNVQSALKGGRLSRYLYNVGLWTVGGDSFETWENCSSESYSSQVCCGQ